MSESRGDADRDNLARQVTEVVRELERVRFGGGNPVVVVPADAGPLDVVARALAAERHNALLRLDGRDFNPQQDEARADLQKALAALRFWSFGAAQSVLDRAGTRATEPALQQRIGLWKTLARLVERFVSADPDDDLRGNPGRLALDALESADRLPAPERDHYRAEVHRLVDLHATARKASDGGLARILWYVLRARLALAHDEPSAALVWCLRAARTDQDQPPQDEYLVGLLDRGRRYILLQMGELPADEAASTRQDVKGLQAWDLYRALTAHLGHVHTLDPHRETTRYSIAPYQATDE